MTETEKRYAQIEKEALATTWACEKFSDYVLGREFEIESDHNPLVPLLNSKHLDHLPPRILRFRLRLARFQYSVHHVPGKQLYAADTMSRAPVSAVGTVSRLFVEELEWFVQTVSSALPASKSRLDVYRQAQEQDTVCARVRKCCQEGWPSKHTVEPDLWPFWKAQALLTFSDGLLLHGQRIVVPQALQQETMQKLHTGHQGVERCRTRARASVWWPGLMTDIQRMVEHCKECAKVSCQRKEPLMPTPLPDFPWQMVASDLFEIKGIHYLLVVDYFSRYPEVVQLKSTTSQSVINALRSIFARHGIPERLRSDNGPQYASREFKCFAEEYEIDHVTSSPHFPQSNGMAERGVKTVKALLLQSSDPFTALLSYRATPLPWCNISPAELLMGRRLRTSVPQTTEQLTPTWPYLEKFRADDQHFKKSQKRGYDRRHGTRELSDIPDETAVWVKTGDQTVQGQVTSSADTPRSFNVEVPSGSLRRNRHHLTVIPEDNAQVTSAEEEHEPTTSEAQPHRIMTRSQTGTPIQPPQRL